MEEGTRQVVMEKKAKPQEQLNCPRCNSSNTKFCYYNNYSLTQPRYFCKTCRRYWTEGGSLRNVPVGGGSRKNKKIITNNNNISNPKIPSSSLVPDLNPPPPKIQGGHDLNLAFPSMENYPFVEIGEHNNNNNNNYVVPMNITRGLNLNPSNNNNYVPPIVSNSSNNASASAIYSSSPGFSMQDVKPNIGFSMDSSLPNRSYGVQLQDHHGNGGGRLLFPFGDIKHLSSSSLQVVEHNNNNNKDNQANNSTGYWSGMIGEGSSW